MNNFKTEDIELAAFLFARGMKYLGLTKDSGEKPIYYFSFEDDANCNQLKIDFINGADAPALKVLQARKMFLNEIKGINAGGVRLRRVNFTDEQLKNIKRSLAFVNDYSDIAIEFHVMELINLIGKAK